MVPGSDGMPPKFAKRTLGRSCQSCWKQHASKLDSHVAGSYDCVKGAEMAPRVSSFVIRCHVGNLKAMMKRCV